MKASENFIFNKDQAEYRIQLKSSHFPWWILLIPLLLLVLLYKVDSTLEIKVIEAESKKPVDEAKVVLSYLENTTNENRTISTNSDKKGKAEFILGQYRLYEILLGKKGDLSQNLYSVRASKEPYLPDSILKRSLKEYQAKEENRLLKLKPLVIAKHDSVPQKPREGCRAFFTGLVVGGEFKHRDISEVYKVDDFSEYVGEGDYPDNSKAFPKAVQYTFDGIAIDKGTQVIIYSKKNFEGDILLDKTGPAIINNIKWKNDSRYAHCNTDTYKEPLQSNFPQSVREWSESDMQKWSYGSLKVKCNK